MKVEEIMTRDVRTCSPETNLAAVAEIMWKNDCGTVPVVDPDRNVVGVITDRDICIAVATKGQLASEIMTGQVCTRDVYACSGDDDIKGALSVMRTEKVRRLAVVDRNGALQGILSLNDIALRAEDASDGKRRDLSTSDLVNTLKAICEHRSHASAAEKSQKTAIA
jgi:CBS domain-containing protein